MRSRRRWLLPVGAFVGLLLLAGAWAGWQAWQVSRDLNAAVDDARALRSAVEAGDQTRIDTELARLQEHSSAAADRTSGSTWSVLTRLPVLGDDADGVALTSDVVADLSNDGLEPLVEAATQLDRFLPRNGRISVDAVESLQSPVERASVALAGADARLSEVDSSGFVERFRVQYRDLARQISDAADGMRAADTALQVLPTMLGSEGPRDHLLVFQNNAEIRATGGLPGAVSIVRTDDGEVEMVRQVSGASFGRRAGPVLPLTGAERKLYGPQLGTYFLDANFTPDFPRTADLMRARWEEMYEERLASVVSVDPVALSYLLEATGPIDVGDVTLTSDNAVDELLHGVYLRFEDPVAQDAYFRDVARTLFERFTAGGIASPRALVSALGAAADEGHVYVHSFDAREQAALSGSQVAGEFPTEATSRPQVAVTMNDGTGAKMSYFLRYDVAVRATSCMDGQQQLAVHAELTSEAPEDAKASLPATVTGGGDYGVPPGQQSVLVRLFAPVDGEIRTFTINSEPARPPGAVVDGRPAATAFLTIKPGEIIDVDWTLQTGPGQDGPTDVFVTPSLEGSLSRTIASAC